MRWIVRVTIVCLTLGNSASAEKPLTIVRDAHGAHVQLDLSAQGYAAVGFR